MENMEIELSKEINKEEKKEEKKEMIEEIIEVKEKTNENEEMDKLKEAINDLGKSEVPIKEIQFRKKRERSDYCPVINENGRRCGKRMNVDCKMKVMVNGKEYTGTCMKHCVTDKCITHKNKRTHEENKIAKNKNQMIPDVTFAKIVSNTTNKISDDKKMILVKVSHIMKMEEENKKKTKELNELENKYFLLNKKYSDLLKEYLIK